MDSRNFPPNKTSNFSSKPWDFDPVVWPNLICQNYLSQEKDEENKFQLIDAGPKDYIKVNQLYKPFGKYEIGKIELIFNESLTIGFENKLKTLDSRVDFDKEYHSKWKEESSGTEKSMRKQVFKGLMDISNEIKGYKKIRVTPMFHGTTRSKINSICTTNFANLYTEDDVGYFGSGIYHTSSAECAHRYTKNADDGILILSWISFLSCYPIIHHPEIKDEKDWSSLSKSHLKKKHWRWHTGRPQKSGYDAHYVQVVSKNNLTFSPFQYGEKPEFDELVVFDSSQILPRYVITLQPHPLNTLQLIPDSYTFRDLEMIINDYLPLCLNIELHNSLTLKLKSIAHIVEESLPTNELKILGQIQYLKKAKKESISCQNCQLILLNELLETHKLKKSKLKNKDLIIRSLKKNYQRAKQISDEVFNFFSVDDYTPAILQQLPPKKSVSGVLSSFEENQSRNWKDIHKNTATPIDQLFSKPGSQYADRKRVLVIGPMGIGKSSLCEYIVNEWAQDAPLWEDRFESIFYVKLRNCQKSDKSDSLGSFLKKYCFTGIDQNNISGCHIDEYILENEARILFVIDGLDEIDLHGIQTDMVNQLLQQPNWILTSRPHAAAHIKSDVTFENVGFTSQMIETYIQSKFPEKSKSILNDIFENRLVLNLCHIPLNLVLICTLFERPNANISAISSMTDVYIQLTLFLKKRFLERIGEENSCTFEESDFEGHNTQSVFQFLEELAWIGFKKGKVLFSFEEGSEMRKCYDSHRPDNIVERIQFIDHIHQSGFLHCKGAEQDFLKYVSPFSPITFQGFFAARYLVRLLKEEKNILNWFIGKTNASSIIEQIKFDPRYKEIILFIAGLLKNEPELEFFTNLLKGSEDNLNLYSELFKIQCMEESNQLQMIGSIWSNGIQYWLQRIITPNDWTYFAKFMIEMDAIVPSRREYCLEIFRASLFHEDIDVREKSSEGLSLLSSFDFKEIIAILKESLKKESNAKVRANICKALGKFVRQEDSEEVIFLFKGVVGNSESTPFEKGAVVEAFGHIGQFNNSVIPLLQTAFSYCNFNTVIEALARIAIVDPTLIPLLKNEIFYTSRPGISAIEWNEDGVFGSLARAHPKEIIAMLTDILHNPDETIRAAAAEVVGALDYLQCGHYSSFSFLLKKVLNDPSCLVKASAIKGATKPFQDITDNSSTLGLEKYLENSLLWLEKAFEEFDIMIRDSAVKALETIVGGILSIKSLEIDKYLKSSLPLFNKGMADSEKEIVLNTLESAGKVFLESIKRQNEQAFNSMCFLFAQALNNGDIHIRKMTINSLPINELLDSIKNGKLTDGHFTSLFSIIQKAFQDKDKGVRLDAINLLAKTADLFESSSNSKNYGEVIPKIYLPIIILLDGALSSDRSERVRRDAAEALMISLNVLDRAVSVSPSIAKTLTDVAKKHSISFVYLADKIDKIILGNEMRISGTFSRSFPYIRFLFEKKNLEPNTSVNLRPSSPSRSNLSFCPSLTSSPKKDLGFMRFNL